MTEPDAGKRAGAADSGDRPTVERERRDPDALGRRAGVRGDPDRDQHFLVDDRVLDRIPGYLPMTADTGHVLEIGGGTGALTDRLLRVGGHVTVVERDPTLAAFLREEFVADVDSGRLAVVEGDALDVDLPAFTACVSNLPYGASSQIAFRLLPRKRPLLLMFQREFAERMAAEPGTSEYGRLSVTAQHYADVEVVEVVPPEAFAPPPAVDSAVVRLTPREPDYDVVDEAAVAAGSGRAGGPVDETFFLDFVKALFTQRRKTIRNAIRNTAHISGLDDPEAVVEAADEGLLRKRAGDLAPGEFAALAALAAEHGFGGDVGPIDDG